MSEGNRHIDPTAVLEPGATLGEGVKVGPFCFVGSQVRLGDHACLVSHVSIAGRTSIGVRARISPFAALGGPPQDLTWNGEDTSLVIGDDVTIRDHVQIHVGTARGRFQETRIGNHVYLMGHSHIAHDCVVGSHVILSQGSMLGGHVEVGDHAVISAGSMVHPHARVGRHAILGGGAIVRGDVIPYGMASGDGATMRGINLIGLQRQSVARSEQKAILEAFTVLFRGDLSLQVALKQLESDSQVMDNERIREMIAFIRESKNSKRYLLPGSRV